MPFCVIPHQVFLWSIFSPALHISEQRLRICNQLPNLYTLPIHSKLSLHQFLCSLEVKIKDARLSPTVETIFNFEWKAIADKNRKCALLLSVSFDLVHFIKEWLKTNRRNRRVSFFLFKTWRRTDERRLRKSQTTLKRLHRSKENSQIWSLPCLPTRLSANMEISRTTSSTTKL